MVLMDVIEKYEANSTESPCVARSQRARPEHPQGLFSFWALVLVVAMFAINDTTAATQYIDSHNLTEPMFVFAIKVIAGSRPVLKRLGPVRSLLPSPSHCPAALDSILPFWRLCLCCGPLSRSLPR